MISNALNTSDHLEQEEKAEDGRAGKEGGREGGRKGWDE